MPPRMAVLLNPHQKSVVENESQPSQPTPTTPTQEAKRAGRTYAQPIHNKNNTKTSTPSPADIYAHFNCAFNNNPG